MNFVQHLVRVRFDKARNNREVPAGEHMHVLRREWLVGGRCNVSAALRERR